MTTRKDTLQRLQVASPCSSSWEAMNGDGRRRHCLECDKAVYDFARLTPREINGVIEASQGELCARLTRDEWGRLVTLQPPSPADPLASRRPSPLVTAVVTAALGLSGTAWTAQATPAAPTAEQGAGSRPEGNRPEGNRPEGNQPEGNRPQRTGDAGGALKGRLANEAGEPIPGAEIKLNNQLDGQERIARTDAEGRFSFASVTAGLYGLAASVGGREVAQQEDILLSADKKPQIEMTVSSYVWESIVAGESEAMTLGGVMMIAPEPIRSLYDDTSLVLLAVAGKSVIVRRQEYTSEVRTELVISSVLKGGTRERVISVYHDQLADEDPASRFHPGDNVLAFLEPREAETGRGSDGYVAADALSGLRALSGAELEAYRDRIESLAQISRSGTAQPAEVLEWLVATTENPATRQEAIGELSWAIRQVEHQAGERQIPVDLYAQKLRNVFADFLSAGGTPEREVSPVILGAFLTDAHRDRLTAALLSPPKGSEPDLLLYEVVGRWHDDRLLPWVINQLKTADLSDGTGLRLMASVAAVLNDEGFESLRATGETRILDLRQQLDNASDESEEERLGKQLKAAQEELRRQLLEALGKRR